MFSTKTRYHHHRGCCTKDQLCWRYQWNAKLWRAQFSKLLFPGNLQHILSLAPRIVTLAPATAPILQSQNLVLPVLPSFTSSTLEVTFVVIQLQSISQEPPTSLLFVGFELVTFPSEMPKSSSAHISSSSVSLKSHEQGIFWPDSPVPKEKPQ